MQRAWHIGRDAPNPLADLSPFRRRFNVLPTTTVPVIRRDREIGQLLLTQARWGLIPPWWKDKKLPRFTINARSEEASGKPMWRQAYRSFRCLIPAEGWYEWPEKEDIDKTTGEIITVGQPHFIFHRDRQPFCFAGLASLWTPPEKDEPILSCAILTRAAAPSIAPVHDRMPVILSKGDFEEWTDPGETDAERVTAIIRDHARDDFDHFAVRKLVNSGKNDSEELIKPSRGCIDLKVRGRGCDELSFNAPIAPFLHAD